MSKSEGTRYAGIWRRFLALLIDALLLCAIFFPVTRIVRGVWIVSVSDHRWVSGLLITDPLRLRFLALMLLCFVLLEGLVGAALGKWLLGLRMVRSDGGEPSLRRSTLRKALRLVDGLAAFSVFGYRGELASAIERRARELFALVRRNGR